MALEHCGKYAWAAAILVMVAKVDAQTAAPGNRYRAVRVAEFGDDQGDGVLSDVFGVAVSTEGHVYVSEPAHSRLVEFDSGGTLVRVLIRRAQAPGELRVPGALFWRGDSLVVSDFRNGLSLYGVEGELYGHISFALDVPGTPFGGRPALLLADGSVGVVVAPTPRTTSPPDETWLKADRAGVMSDTIVALPVRGRSFSFVVDGRKRSGSHPLASSPLLTAPPDVTSFVIVEREPPRSAGPATFRVVRLSLDGDTIAQRLIGYAPRAVTKEVVDSLVASLAAQMSERMHVRPSALASAMEEQVEWPSYAPPVVGALAGIDGSVWLEREDSGEQVRWEILDEDLASVGEVRLPNDLDVKVVTRHTLWAIEKNSLAASRVVRFELTQEGR